MLGGGVGEGGRYAGVGEVCGKGGKVCVERAEGVHGDVCVWREGKMCVGEEVGKCLCGGCMCGEGKACVWGRIEYGVGEEVGKCLYCGMCVCWRGKGVYVWGEMCVGRKMSICWRRSR